MTPKQKSEDIAKAGLEYDNAIKEIETRAGKAEARKVIAGNIARKHGINEAFFIKLNHHPASNKSNEVSKKQVKIENYEDRIL